MKINSRLKRSRHGVYYYRFVIPKKLSSQFDGKREIKRSLGTKDPKLAQLYAHILAINLSTDLPIMSLLKNANAFNIDQLKDMKNISTWVVSRPDGTKLEADPNNEKDLASAERLAKALFAPNAANQTAIKSNVDGSQEKLLTAIPIWLERLKLEQLRSKTIDEYQSKFKIFVKFVSNANVTDISAKDISHFSVALSNGKVTGKPLSKSTINKYISAINSFFVVCKKIQIWPVDKPLPTINQHLGKPKKQTQSYQPFTPEELNKIFDLNNLQKDGKFEPHKFWLPMLALFSGARIEELCQLAITDIKQNANVWVIDINDRNESKKLKTNAAERTVPIHPIVIEHGFLNYIETLKTHFPNEQMLFPYLLPDTYNKFSSAPSKWFAKYLNKIGITDKLKVFHSFRSTFNNKLKTAEISEEIRCQLLGHEYDSVNSKHYSNQHDSRWLMDKVMSKVNYSELSLPNYKRDQNKTADLLRILIQSRNSKLKHNTNKRHH